MTRLHTTRYVGPSHKPRITHDERRNETYYPEEIEREMDASAESRETIREYVLRTLEDGKEPDARGFKAEHDVGSVRWDHDAVDAEIDRLLLTEAIALRNDIRNYVKAGGWDAFSFSALAYPRYKSVAGRVIQRMIDTEKTERSERRALV